MRDDVQSRSRFEIVRTYDDLSEPRAEELKRELISDADADCPRCGSTGWLLVERRADPVEPFTRWRALVCATCGLSEGWGSAGRARPGRKDERRREWEHERVPGLPEVPTAQDLAGVACFGVFAPSDSPTLRSHSYERGRLIAITVADGGLEVRTEIRHQVLYSLPFEPDTPEQRARQRLQQVLTDRRAIFERRLSEPAQQLAMAQLAHHAEAKASAAAARDATVELNGVPHTFALVETPAQWAAAAHVGDETVTVLGEGTPPSEMALRTLRGIATSAS